MAQNQIDIRALQEQKIEELYNIQLTEENAKDVKSAADAISVLIKTEFETGKMVDDYVLEKERIDLEREKFEYEKEKDNQNHKMEKITVGIKIAGVVVTVVTLAVDIFGKLVVLGTDECSPRAMSRSCRDWLESKVVKKPDLKL